LQQNEISRRRKRRAVSFEQNATRVVFEKQFVDSRAVVGFEQ
jgi:hypothetical protein